MSSRDDRPLLWVAPEERASRRSCTTHATGFAAARSSLARDHARVDSRRGASRPEQRAQEVVVFWILDAVAVRVFPPAPAEVSGVPRPEFRRAVFEPLELALHRQRIDRDERVVIESLARDEDDTRRAAPSAWRCEQAGWNCGSQQQQSVFAVHVAAPLFERRSP